MKAWLPGYKWQKVLTIGTLCIMVAFGLMLTIFELKPFWLDEWFIIYNLKFKTAAELWGGLDMVQQFPRAYLQIVKFVTAQFNYSYTSLRASSFVVHSTGLIFCYLLSRRLFGQSPYRFLWVLVYASYFTSVHYFVQVKQYTMDMLLALVAIWQFAELLSIRGQSKGRYVILCIVSMAIPYFSYTYPIAFAPVLLLAFWLNKGSQKDLLKISIPIALTLLSIVVFYRVDVIQVMNDQGMQDYWKGYLMKDGFSFSIFFEKIYRLFANLGSGALFEIIFGTLGIISLLYATFSIFKKGNDSLFSHTVKYSAILIWLIIGLFILHKLPLGAHRLNAFAVPACGILIVNLLIDAGKIKKFSKLSPVFAAMLVVAMSIGIFTSFIDQLTGTEAIKTRRIYQNVETGIKQAQKENLPIAVTPGIGYPFEDGQKDWALKTHPAYDIRTEIPVYAVKDIEELRGLFRDSTRLNALVFIEKEKHGVVNRQTLNYE